MIIVFPTSLSSNLKVENYELLVQYQEENGNCNVPLNKKQIMVQILDGGYQDNV